jgi:putative redox protein
MIDKSKELTTNLILVNNRLHFEGHTEGQEPVQIDYIPPLGDNQGYTSLELLLLSLSSCLGTAVLAFLRRMEKNITQLSIQAHGLRRQEHPTGLEQIRLRMELVSENTTLEDAQKVVAMAEEKYCPVWAMIRGNVEVQVEYVIRL